jgi:hypothetical protein
MASQFPYPVVGHREYAHYPLHYGRKICAICRPDDEMKMVPHDTEIFDPEPVFSTSSFQD